MNTQHILNTKSRKGEIRHCSICGETGHIASTHHRRTTKVCNGCNLELPLSDFSPKRRMAETVTYIYTNDKCKECSRLKSKARYRSNFQTRLSYLLSTIKSRHSNSGISVTLTIEDLMSQYEKQSGLCYYSDQPLSLDTGNYAVSVDRVDPFGPYSSDNIVLVCWLVNHMKRQQTHDEFITLCKRIAANH